MPTPFGLGSSPGTFTDRHPVKQEKIQKPEPKPRPQEVDTRTPSGKKLPY